MDSLAGKSKAVIESYLVEHYGLLLTQAQLAKFLGRSVKGLCYSLSRPSDARIRAIKASGRRLGREVRYPANEIAEIIDSATDT
jgi:hypothetical protein